MVFQITIILCFLQHVLIIMLGRVLSGHCHRLPFRHTLDTDKAALLAFKSTISSDPHSRLANWNESTHACSFEHVRCDSHHQLRVVRINLNDSGLVGLLSPFLSNLTQLRVLELVNNQLFGFIPSDFSSLGRLRILKLDGNNLHGPIPASFSSLSKLTLISLSGNNLSGTIPPIFFSNCTLLHNVDLSENFLIGNIPAEIGNCHNLWNLNIYSNQLTGEIPFSLTNASAIYNLDVENNHLSGKLPSGIVSKLQEIWYLHLSHNHMISHDGNTNLEPFFTALSNCSELKELELAGMGLGGSLPNAIGGMTADLETILLQENHIHGSIPPHIANLSGLTVLNFTFNLITGTIPAEIGQLLELEQLSLSYNSLTGEIPAKLGQLFRLGMIDLSHNQLSGEIPASLGNIVRINSLLLNNNFLTGQIPQSLGHCTDLYRIDLSYNGLTGSIPPEIVGIREIRIFLNLSHNQLGGHLPIELSKLENVQEIDLSSNKLSGSIFVQISKCIALRLINFSNNFLEGQLPESLGDLKNLEVLDVSQNKLSGTIPTSLNKIHTLLFLDLSFNDFSGMIPAGGLFNSATLTFKGNRHLCGIIPGFPACHQKQKYSHSLMFLIVFCIVISVSAFFSTICCVVGCRRLKAIISSTNQSVREKKLAPDLMHNFPRITYKELSEATGGFDDGRLIGSGSYGRVYKGVLPNGIPIAVKVLNLQTGNSTKSFNRECQVLKRIRHRNLMRIITACSLPDFKALVLPYMGNGSLDSRLYPNSGTSLNSGSSELGLLQRINICSDIAEGMAYLHHHSPVKIIHCDLKPSNVLLNDDMTALVSDFGIARLVMTAGEGNAGVIENMGSSTANMLRGSVGYIAPEYGFGASISTKGDVYSFGVLVLEMVSRKRPTDDMFGGGLNLHKYVKTCYHGQMEKVLDSSLMRAIRNQATEVKKMWEVAVGELIELGILCTQEAPSMRPTMLDAADDLDRLKTYLSGDTTTATFASSLGVSSSSIFSSD